MFQRPNQNNIITGNFMSYEIRLENDKRVAKITNKVALSIIDNIEGYFTSSKSRTKFIIDSNKYNLESDDITIYLESGMYLIKR